MNPWGAPPYSGQQWQQPTVVPQQRAATSAPLQPTSAPPQRHPPPAPPRPQFIQQQPPAAHIQRVAYSAPPPMPSPAPHSHQQPVPTAVEAPHIAHEFTLLREFGTLVAAAIRDQEARTSARFDNLEIAIGSLSKLTAEVLELAKVARQETKNNADRGPSPTQKEMKDAFAGIHNFITQATRAVLGKTERLESMLGDPSTPDYDNSKKTVFGRIDGLEQAFLELSETVNDPEAARPTVVRHEVAVNTSPEPRMTADVGINALASPSPLQLPKPLPLPQVAEAGVQAEGPVLVDAEVETSTEVPRRFSTESGTVYAPSPTSPRAAPLFPKAFAVQSLAPARWTPRDEDTESSISDAPYRPAVHAQNSERDERFASSVFDEQEIDTSLGDGADETTQGSHSSPIPPQHTPTLSSLTASPVTLPSGIAVSPMLAPAVPTIAPPVVPVRPLRPKTPAASSTPATLEPSPSSPPNPRGDSATGDLSHRILLSPGVAPRALSPSAVSSSSLSSVPASPPLLPPQQAEKSQTAPPRPQLVERTTSSSSMSSLTSVESGKSTPVPNPVESASVAAPVKVKTERTENALVGRPSKRRKTIANPGGVLIKFENPQAGSSSARRGRGGDSSARGGRGRGRGGGRGGRRKSQLLLITPIKEPAPPPVPEAPRQRYEAPRIGTDCPWPGKVSGDDHREFVACDHCEGWYHFGCVGLTKGDPRLEVDAEFICPPCESSSAICEQRRSVRFHEAACLRPDCDHPGAAEDTNEYFVERIIGRRPYRAEIDVDVSHPTKFMWLVKWDGWKADDATWVSYEHLGECSRIIEEFEQAAEIEGRDLAQQDTAILLNEAAAVGWGGVRF